MIKNSGNIKDTIVFISETNAIVLKQDFPVTGNQFEKIF